MPERAPWRLVLALWLAMVVAWLVIDHLRGFAAATWWTLGGIIGLLIVVTILRVLMAPFVWIAEAILQRRSEIGARNVRANATSDFRSRSLMPNQRSQSVFVGSMDEWFADTSVRLPLTRAIENTMHDIQRATVDEDLPNIQRLAHELAALADRAEEEVPLPPDGQAAKLWLRWCTFIRLVGDETVRAVQSTHDLGPAGNMAEQAAETMTAFLAVTSTLRQDGGKGHLR
jgi:hypothetical protein